jgi:archaellin
MQARKLRESISRFFGALCLAARANRGIVATDLALISLLAGASLLTGTLISGGQLGASELEDALHSGLGVASGTLYVRGSIVAASDASTRTVQTINLPLAATDGLRALDMTPGSTSRPTISFSDATAYIADVPYDVNWTTGNGDSMFEGGESAVLVLRMDALAAGAPDIRPNDRWTVEVVSTSGGAIELSRTMPPAFDPVMNLH